MPSTAGYRSGSAIGPIDTAYWDSLFQRGFGESAFSSPVWQRLMAEQLGPEWRPRALRAWGPGGPLTIPVFSRPRSLGRHELCVQPVAYYVTPMEKAVLDEQDLEAVLDALCTWRVCHFTWWLPPWSPTYERLRSQFRGVGRLEVKSVDTYVIPLETSADEHFASRLKTNQQRHRRKNAKADVRIVVNPPEAMREAYFELYGRVFSDRNWVGDRFPKSMFDGISAMGDGGQLVLVYHEERLVGGGILLFDRYSAHFFQGTTDREAKGIYPHVALYEHALREAERRGLKRVNLGGINTGNEGLARFKMAWGAEPVAVPILQWQSGPRVLRNRFGV